MIEYLNTEMDNVEVLGLELKCYGSDDAQLVLVPNIVGQSVASIDRRESPSKYRQWKPDDLREAFSELEDSELGAAYIQVLDWAEESGRLMTSSAKYACFGVANSEGARTMGLYFLDGPWAYFEASKFASLDDRDQYVELLKQAGLLDKGFDPNQQVQKRLDFATNEDATALIGVLESI